MPAYFKDGNMIEGVSAINVGSGDSFNILKSTQKRIFVTGTYVGGQPAFTINLPNATTLSLYQAFTLENAQTSVPVTVKDFAGNTLVTFSGIRTLTFTTHSIALSVGDWKQQSGGQGATGTVGLTGIQGQTGIVGINGVTGVAGVAGINGATGITGLQGITGVQGITGLQGVTGLQGFTGFVGPTGYKGDTGVQGVTGPGTASVIKTGTQAITLNATSVSIIFGVAYGDADYIPTWSIRNTVDALPMFQPGTITAQTASGFTISFNAGWDSANYTLAYIAST